MLLQEQATLQTPVAVFSAHHERAAVEPEQAQFYKRLLPLSKPKTGEQYAFKVDMDRCTGCKACVSACHSLNGLDENETWRDVGTIQGGCGSDAYAQTITTACHHCVDPGCLNGCPVLAYEKDPETGIVRHLDDQCIGCQYCVLKCPYDVPKYSKKLGIVRKCDMCHNRLAEGEAPACVQACPTEAISITIVDTSGILESSKSERDFLPAAPEPSYTKPTTRYVTNKFIPANVEASDNYALHPEHAHYPLVFMLTLMQLSVGLYAAALLAGEGAASTVTRVFAFVAMSLGLIASTSHLGRPLGAWRAFLGLRRSWLSREIVVFGGFSAVAGLYTAAAFLPFIPEMIEKLSGYGTLLIGLVGTFCSVMIYQDTQRPFWRLPVSGGKFFGTAILLGLAGFLSVLSFTGLRPSGLFVVLFLFAALKFGLEALQLRLPAEGGMTPARKSALLLRRPLKAYTFARFAFGIAGVLCFAVPGSPVLGGLGFLLLLTGELLERALFFMAVAAPKMPGSITS